MFVITARIEYSLTLLVLLGKNYGQSPMSLGKVAKLTGMPYRFLTQVVKPLIKAGFIIAREGKDGGYVLKIKPQNIKLKNIFSLLGEDFNFVRCFRKKNICFSQKTCKMKSVWLRIKVAIEREINSMTLKDLL